MTEAELNKMNVASLKKRVADMSIEAGSSVKNMKKADLVNLCMKLAKDVSGTAKINAFMVAKRAPDTGDSHAPPAKQQRV